jgi:phosphate transport system permease protein
VKGVKELLIEKLLFITGLSSIIVLITIFVFLLKEAYPAFLEIGVTEFVTGTRWLPASKNPGYGALPLILGTSMVTLMALLIAVPWGVATAAYISEVAHPKIKDLLKSTIEMLALFPSVVIGFIALVVVAPIIARTFNLSNGLTAFTGGVMLAIMAMPTIVSISEDAFYAVPRSYREASYALGATKWQTVKGVVLPSAASGIIAAVMLGLGRAIGETMTVLMATGNSISMPLKGVIPDYLTSVRTMTADVAIEASEVPWGSLHWHALFVIAAMLFIMTFLPNLVADIVLHRFEEEIGK